MGVVEGQAHAHAVADAQREPPVADRELRAGQGLLAGRGLPGEPAAVALRDLPDERRNRVAPEAVEIGRVRRAVMPRLRAAVEHAEQRGVEQHDLLRLAHRDGRHVVVEVAKPAQHPHPGHAVLMLSLERRVEDGAGLVLRPIGDEVLLLARPPRRNDLRAAETLRPLVEVVPADLRQDQPIGPVRRQAQRAHEPVGEALPEETVYDRARGAVAFAPLRVRHEPVQREKVDSRRVAVLPLPGIESDLLDVGEMDPQALALVGAQRAPHGRQVPPFEFDQQHPHIYPGRAPFL